MSNTLVIVDMQNDFITGSLGNKYIESNVLPNIVNKIKLGDYDSLVFTMDTHQSNYLETFEGKNLPVTHCIENTKGWELHDEIKELLDFDSMCVKTTNKHFLIKTKDSFGATGLLFTIDQVNSFNRPDIIEICGVCTDICVVTNAIILRCAAPDTRIVCDSICCGGTSKEAHDSALRIMNNCQIEIIS